LIKVHHLNNSRSQRVLWLLEEIGLDYEVVRYQRDAKTMLAPASLRAIHPLLGPGPWFVGSAFSAADIMMSFPLEAASSRGGLNASRPNLMSFLARIHARPAYQRALTRGGPYAFAR
jgi:glutathione S-transferase